jgi:TRAP-type C4-dicarboxylate transport system permease large subunit
MERLGPPDDIQRAGRYRFRIRQRAHRRGDVPEYLRVLIFGAQIFSFFVGVSALAEGVTEFVRNLHWAPLAVMALLLVLYLVLGLITVPIVTPLVQDLGYDLESGGASFCSL